MENVVAPSQRKQSDRHGRLPLRHPTALSQHDLRVKRLPNSLGKTSNDEFPLTVFVDLTHGVLYPHHGLKSESQGLECPDLAATCLKCPDAQPGNSGHCTVPTEDSTSIESGALKALSHVELRITHMVPTVDPSAASSAEIHWQATICLKCSDTWRCYSEHHHYPVPTVDFKTKTDCLGSTHSTQASPAPLAGKPDCNCNWLRTEPSGHVIGLEHCTAWCMHPRPNSQQCGCASIPPKPI
eukprot:TRINITY_DN66915_c9_g5_i1.p1 TRINITY_DN66915_c9_g5~~TRINITY_DN66915_c9_g5_i1.p1  ORF type:complete len:240 (+),score=3.31 TRINITY_DN66915_c9_g5_i1:110-829(+)